MAEKLLLRAQKDLWNGTPGAWAQGFRSGNVVFLQGQTGLTLDGDVVHPYDAARPAGCVTMVPTDSSTRSGPDF
jgi:enamine deaminase RidA (YjgF/YER057c/UK114 family)